jgi:type I restriction enzyme S subunit
VKFDEPLPKGWALTRCSDFCSGRNQTFNPAKAGDEEFILYSVPSHETGKPETVRASEIGSNKQFVSAGDTLISKINPRLNRTWVVGQHPSKKIIASTEWIVFGRSSAFVPEFLSYFLRQGAVRDFLSHNASGVGGSLTRIRASIFDEVSLPLPPLAEQKRIVAKIEALFSELEAGEESLRVARRQLGVYRQSLLKQAFEGHLTAKWRTQNPAKLESPGVSDVPGEELVGFAELPPVWRYTRFGRFVRHIDAGKSFRCEERRPNPTEIGVAKVSAVTWGEYDEAESKTCIDPEKVKPGYFIRPGDFILSRANTIELVGASVIVRHVTQNVMLSDKTLRLTMDDALKPFFLHYLRSRQGRLQIEKRSTGNQESMRNIGQDRIRSIIVPECSLPEQQEIVRLLDSAVEVIERNEREIDGALRSSEALRQAILQKAFSGRLVPQDPSDEPASTLLARLRAAPAESTVRRDRKATQSQAIR